MAQTTVSVHGRTYTLACENGEEELLQKLARYLDHHIAELTEAMGAVGETRLLLMAGLIVADELSGAMGRLAELEDEVAEIKVTLTTPTKGGKRAEKQVADALDKAAVRLETITQRVAALKTTAGSDTKVRSDTSQSTEKA